MTMAERRQDARDALDFLSEYLTGRTLYSREGGKILDAEEVDDALVRIGAFLHHPGHGKSIPRGTG